MRPVFFFSFPNCSLQHGKFVIVLLGIENSICIKSNKKGNVSFCGLSAEFG